ncbi:MAG TPA: hypothetical protein GX532_07965 [Clostridia bacterium]|jgi:hypothetical protein|nr:hypothetical protein [Clostridia bacterium]HHY06891.1 hypothetical protein [Clostridia bacterium]
MFINLQNDIGMVKQVKVGFSWTALFFGVFVPILRGDWKWALIMVFLAIITFGISWIVFPFVYNKIYINNLLEKGYLPADDNSRSILVTKGFISAQ